MLVDTHVHYDMLIGDGVMSADDIMQGYADEGLDAAVQVSINPDGFQWARKFSVGRSDKKVMFTAGIHPSSPAGEHEFKTQRDFVKDVFESDDSRLLFGIGECGLDFFRMRRPENEQIKSFESQIELAKVYGLPLIVHSRDAMKECLDILRNNRPPLILMHCFPGDAKDASKLLDLGAYISFAGNLTYPKALPLHESAAYIPADRLLFETDAPFLAPVPLRGKKNIPSNISHTIGFAASLKKMDADELAAQAYKNFELITDRKYS